MNPLLEITIFYTVILTRKLDLGSILLLRTSEKKYTKMDFSNLNFSIELNFLLCNRNYNRILTRVFQHHIENNMFKLLY